MERLRVASKGANLLATLGLAAGLICIVLPGTSAAFDNSSLTGGYGCIGQSSGGATGVSEMMRLKFDGAGKVRGRIVFDLEGEVCTIVTTGGTYSIDSGGVGTIALPWTTASADADGDSTFCSNASAQVVSQHMRLVIERKGAIFDFQADDDFLTGPTLTEGTSTDLSILFTGSCKTQG
jgi:hypothetical protein